MSAASDIHLVQHDHPCLLGKPLVKLGHLLFDLFTVGQWVVQRCIDNVNQDPRPLDVAKEIVSQADTLVSALNKAGDVHHEEL